MCSSVTSPDALSQPTIHLGAVVHHSEYLERERALGFSVINRRTRYAQHASSSHAQISYSQILYDYIAENKQTKIKQTPLPHKNKTNNNHQTPTWSSHQGESTQHKLGITVLLQRDDLSILNKTSCICWTLVEVCGSGRKIKKIKEIAYMFMCLYNREEGGCGKQCQISTHSDSNQLAYYFKEPYESKCKGKIVN